MRKRLSLILLLCYSLCAAEVPLPALFCVIHSTRDGQGIEILKLAENRYAFVLCHHQELSPGNPDPRPSYCQLLSKILLDDDQFRSFVNSFMEEAQAESARENTIRFFWFAVAGLGAAVSFPAALGVVMDARKGMFFTPTSKALLAGIAWAIPTHALVVHYYYRIKTLNTAQEALASAPGSGPKKIDVTDKSWKVFLRFFKEQLKAFESRQAIKLPPTLPTPDQLHLN